MVGYKRLSLSSVARGGTYHLCVTPNSAAAERVFSQMKAMFGDQQMEILPDIIQAALVLRINKRSVG